jgi:hypothetical protein
MEQLIETGASEVHGLNNFFKEISSERMKCQPTAERRAESIDCFIGR